MARIGSTTARSSPSTSAEVPVWQRLLRASITDPRELCRRLDLPPEWADQARSAAAQFPLQVPEPWLGRIRPGDPRDPLLLQVFPQAAETLSAPGFSPDPLAEHQRCCAPGLLWKYHARCLMVASRRCAVHCRFCFRRHQRFERQPGDQWAQGPKPPDHSAGEARRAAVSRPQEATRPNRDPPLPPWWQPALERIGREQSLHEVILSGGDPLSLDDRTLEWLISHLSQIPHVRRIRIHTRLPVAVPQRVTGALLDVLAGARLAILVVLHVNHARELDAQTAAAVGRIVDAGIPVLSQGVLLRGVNDRLDALSALYERLIDLRVMPYYLHQLDRVAGAAHFEVPVETGRRLIAALRERLPGYAVPRYVRDAPDGACKEILA